MKIYKKILAGLIFSILSFQLIAFAFSSQVSAEPANNDTFKNLQPEVTSVLNNKVASAIVIIDGEDYPFSDLDVNDGGNNLKYYGSGKFICSQSNAPSNHGINVTGPRQQYQDGFRYPATIQLVYWGNTDEPCQNGQQNTLLPVTNIWLYFQVTNKPPPDSDPPPGTTEEEPTCESNNALGLEWLFCPVLRGIDKAVNAFYNEVEDQLCFKAGASSTAGNTVCAGGNLLNADVRRAWSSMRVIATSLLVVVMLMMVISQAANIGPLDAYTVRKLLPRMVAVAILIQISWYLAKFSVDIFNDLGVGVQSLMYAPFGAEVEDIDAALGNIGGGTIIFSTLFAAGLAAVAVFASGLTIIGVALLAVPVLLAILIGYLVLVFRQILILLCVLVIPIALVLWILPGTERYWRLWRETFIKLLVMFPMITALIAAGRIFGTVGSDAAGGLAALIIILVGFFGPLLILPKTFNWGGSALATLGGAMVNGTRGIRRKPLDYGLAAARSNREQKGVDRAERLANRRGRRLDAWLAGSRNLALNPTARRNRYQDTLEKGRKAADEAAVRSVIGGQYERLDHPDKVAADILVAQGRLDDQYGTGMDGRHGATQRAALDRLAAYGDWDAVSAVREGGYMGEEGERIWQQFVAKNIGAIHQNVPHLSPQRRDLSSLGRGEFRAVKDFEWEEYGRAAEQGTVRDAQYGLPQSAPDQIEQRSRFISQAKGMLDDEQFMATVSATGRTAIERVANMQDMSPAVNVEKDRVGRVTGVRVPVHSFEPNARPEDTAAALQSINNNLMHEDSKVSGTTRAELGRLIGSGQLSSSTQHALESHVASLGLQAESSADARQAYQEVVGHINTELSARDQRMRSGVASVVEATPQQVELASNVIQDEVDAARTRMQSRGINVPEGPSTARPEERAGAPGEIVIPHTYRPRGEREE